MLHGNLATRPFYNERLATLAIGAVVVVAVLLTTFNVSRLVSLSTQRRELGARIARDQAEASRVRAEAAAAQQEVGAATLGELALATTEANALIDQRTFSWTSFFTLIEKTLPIDVRLVMVSPRVDGGQFIVTMTVVARNLSDVASFSDALRRTSAFLDVAAVEQQRRTDGTYSATIEAAYVSTGSTSLASMTSAEAP